MSSRPHHRPRQQQPSSQPSRRPSARAAGARVPQQRSATQEAPLLAHPPVFVADDAAGLVLHREAHDTDFQQAVDEMPLTRMVGEYLDWVGEGVSPPADEADQADLVAQLEERLGVHFVTSSAVGRRRAQVIAMACARLRLVTTVGEGLEPGPDRAGWNDPDPVTRVWLRSQVAAAVLECSVRLLAGDHLLGDEVRHAFATVVVAAGEGQPCVLGLRSATLLGDLAAEHVDRIVNEHVAELQALGLCAPGGLLAPAPGVEAVLRSVAVGLRNEPVPSALG